MSQSGEAAEQIVNMATNVTVKGVEAVANIAGKGALSLVTFLIAALKDQKRTKGKIRMQSFNGKPTKVFVIKNSELPAFAKEAKKYGILYAAVVNRKEPNGVCDIVVNANDAAKINRIAERFELSTVDIEKIREDIAKSKQERQPDTERERTNPPAEKQAKSVDEKEKNITPDKPTQTTHKQPLNPTKARTERTSQQTAKSNPFAPTSENKDDSRKSVRQDIKEIKDERKQQSPGKQRERTKSKSKPKTKGGR